MTETCLRCGRRFDGTYSASELSYHLQSHSVEDSWIAAARTAALAKGGVVRDLVAESLKQNLAEAREKRKRESKIVEEFVTED